LEVWFDEIMEKELEKPRRLFSRKLRILFLLIIASAIAGAVLALVVPTTRFFRSHGQDSQREQRAIAIAQNTLREHKLKPEDFDPPVVHYNTNNQHWGVTFWPKSRVIEGDVFIVIDDKTDKIVSASRGLGPL
jgi:hypothetical protein